MLETVYRLEGTGTCRRREQVHACAVQQWPQVGDADLWAFAQGAWPGVYIAFCSSL